MCGFFGIIISVLGVLMFRPLHDLGVSPFGHLAQDDELLRSLHRVRYIAYAAVISGIALMVGAVIAWKRYKR